MANWYGTSRSNYFKVKDIDEFIAAMERVHVRWNRKDPDQLTTFMVYTDDNDGDWPSTIYGQGDGEDEDIWFPEYVSQFLVDGEVAIFMTAGAEKVRYVSGVATAIDNTGKYVEVSLNDIYPKAKAFFGVEPTAARY